MQLKVPESLRPQVHSGVVLGMVTVVFWQGLLKNVPKRLCKQHSFLARLMYKCMARLLDDSVVCQGCLDELYMCCDTQHLEKRRVPGLDALSLLGVVCRTTQGDGTQG